MNIIRRILLVAGALSLFLVAFAILVFTIPPRSRSEAPGPAGRHVISVSAQKFSFTPAVITLKKGEEVTLQLTSEDVTHGFLAKSLKIGEQIQPGRTTELTIKPEVTGTFRTSCDRYCGPGHSDMHLTIIVNE